MFYVGVDLGGTNIAVGLVNEKGEIVAKGSTPTALPRPYQEIIADIAAETLRVIEKAGCSLDEVKAIGAGVPGVCNPKTGTIVECVNLHWKEIPFMAEMKKYIDKPVYLDNDATVAGLAEAVAGVSAGIDNSVFLTLGTGVGGGIVIGGKVYSGSHNVGSELGHMIIEMDGELCNCQNRGCFERYASATAIILDGRRAMAAHPESLLSTLCGGDPAKMEAKTGFDAAKEGDEIALKVFRRYVKGLAIGIVNIINVLDPEVVVLGGGVSKAGDFLLDAVREAVKPYILFKALPYARIEIAKLGSDAGIIGAAMLGR